MSEMTIADKIIRAKQDIDDAYEAGKQDENSRMWDIIQNNGEAKIQQYRYPTWTDENFKPKHTVYVDTGTWSSREVTKAYCDYCGMTDLRPETVGVDIDWSTCKRFNNILMHTPVKYVGVIDMTNAEQGYSIFQKANALEEVEKLILPKPEAKIIFKSYGFNSPALREIRFEGVFVGDVWFKQCPLSYESIMSILSCLQDLTGTGTTCVLTLGTTNLAKITETEKAIATEKGWSLA